VKLVLDPAPFEEVEEVLAVINSPREDVLEPRVKNIEGVVVTVGKSAARAIRT
jgi:hypothetical protein